MGRVYEQIDAEIAAWIKRQRVFFVATAPRDGELINCSPKGLDTLQILGPRELAYVDVGGSGIETVAHVKENGRVVLMMCAFEGSPKIFRFYGRGTVVEPHAPEFELLLKRFPVPPACRAIVRVAVTRIQDSCGYGVPLYEFKGHRDTMSRYVAAKTREQLQASVVQSNKVSLEGLAGLEAKADLFVAEQGDA
jgi:hypothetical protein